MAQVLRRLNALAPATDPALLVGLATGDDAAVYRLDDRTAMVFTVDFFTPIVDDAYDWGRIAVANALSDVYAMGGRPLLCLNIAGWPAGVLPMDLLASVLEGGAAVAAQAGAIVAGGHTIDDPEPKYGMAVVGFADPSRLLRNDAASPGDRLVLTKPLGLGVISTGIKRGEVGEETIARAVEVMTTLNAAASEAALVAGVRAATDVTGFGLLGHLQKMLESSGTSATIRAGAVPIIEEAIGLARAGVVPSGTRRNEEFLAHFVEFDDAVPPEIRTLLADAQTSGGMLLACPQDAHGALSEALSERGVPAATIGSVGAGSAGTLGVLAT